MGPIGLLLCHARTMLQHASDDGRSRAASTLLERLRWVGEDFAGEAGSSSSPGSSAWLPSREHAYEAALAGGADGLAPLLPRVCEDRAEDLARSPGVRSDASEPSSRSAGHCRSSPSTHLTRRYVPMHRCVMRS